MADRRLQVFRAVARHQSFTRAANALLMTQPAVTFQIKQLETQYRTRLFERRHGSISLTAAGELVLAYAEKILALDDEMETRLEEMSSEITGPLTVGAVPGLGEHLLPRVLGEFNALYPRVRVCLIIANGEQIEQRVVAHSLDLGLIESAPHLPGLAAKRCGEAGLQVVCAPDYPLAGQSSLRARDLADYEYIARENGSTTRQVSEAYLRAGGLPPEALKLQMELGSPAALKGVVATGLGFAILSRLALEPELSQGRLCAIPLEPPLSQKIHLIYPQDRFQARVVAAFIDFAARQLRQLLSES